jgi:hypothetical protein
MANPKNKRIIQASGVVAAIVGAVVAREAVAHLLSKPEPNVRSRAFLTQVASEANKTTPSMVDKETELTTMTALDGVFVYNYRLVSYTKANLNVPKLLANLQPGVVTSSCTNPDTRETFLKKGVVLRYSYADKDRAFLTSFDVAEADCAH